MERDNINLQAAASLKPAGKFKYNSRMKKDLDPRGIAKDWQERGYSCGLWIDPPGQEWIGYVHDTDELILVLEGDLELELQGRWRHCPPGEEVFIPAGAVHSVRNPGSTTARWLYGYRRS